MSSSAPGFERTTLDNGLRVVTSSMSHTRSVTVSVYAGVGSRYEPDDRAGISHVVEHLVFKGTERRPHPIDISGGVEGVGGRAERLDRAGDDRLLEQGRPAVSRGTRSTS